MDASTTPRPGFPEQPELPVIRPPKQRSDSPQAAHRRRLARNKH